MLCAKTDSLDKMTPIKLVPLVEGMLEVIRMQQLEYQTPCNLCGKNPAVTFMELCVKCSDDNIKQNGHKTECKCVDCFGDFSGGDDE